METPRTPDSQLSVWAAGGGHGATTVAGALGALLRAPVCSHDSDALEWMWGRARGSSLGQGITVRDAGVIKDAFPMQHTNVVVLRGPCSLALRRLAKRSNSIDHLVLFREPWRPLRTKDAVDALGRGIAVEIPFSFRVARLMDAGLLRARIRSLEEFADLKVWAEGTLVRSLAIPTAMVEAPGPAQR